MWNITSHVKYFQSKLGNYDKQTGEQSVEQRILQDIDNGEVEGKHAFLIDVDVVRGTVFAKNKPRHGWLHALSLGILRSVFAPFYWDYWRKHLSFRWTAYIMFHFILQFMQAICFLLIDVDKVRSSQDDVLVPCLLAVCLGILHTHITAAHTGLSSSANVLGEHESKPQVSNRVCSRSTSLDPTEEIVLPAERLPTKSRFKSLMSAAKSSIHDPTGTGLGDIHELSPVGVPTVDIIEQPTFVPNQRGSPYPIPSTLGILEPNVTNLSDHPIAAEQPITSMNAFVNSQVPSSNTTNLSALLTTSVSPPAYSWKPTLEAHALTSYPTVTEEVENETDDVWASQFQSDSPNGSSATFYPEEQYFRDVQQCLPNGVNLTKGGAENHLFRFANDAILNIPLKPLHAPEMHIRRRKLPGPVWHTQPLSVSTANPSSQTRPHSDAAHMPSEVTSIWHDSVSATTPSCVLQSWHLNDHAELGSRITDSTRTQLDETAETKQRITHYAAGLEPYTNREEEPEGANSNNLLPISQGSDTRLHGNKINGDGRDVQKVPEAEVQGRTPTLKRRRSWSVSFPAEPAWGIPPLHFGSMFSTSNYLLSMLTDDSQALALQPNSGTLLSTLPGYLPLWLRSIPPTVKVTPALTASHLLRFYSEELDNNRCTKNSPICRVPSNITLSSEGSTSSAVTECEKNQFRAEHRLDLEAFDGIGAGLNANPVCIANPHPDSKPTACFSKFEATSDTPQVNAERVVQHQSGMTTSKSLTSLLDRFDEAPVLFPCSKPVPGSQKTISDIAGFLPSSQRLSQTDSPHVDGNEDTFTAHSRQRAKFLRIFLQRAGLNHPPHRSSHLGHVQSPKVHQHSTANQLSRSTNLLQLDNAPFEFSTATNERDLSEMRLKNDDVSTRTGETNGLSGVQFDELHSKRVSPHTKHPTLGSIPKKTSYSSKQYWTPGSKLRVPSRLSRGQTASETEFDRLNSDVGSDVDSSSGPDEIDPITPTAPCTVEATTWLSEPRNRMLRGSGRVFNFGADHYTSWSSIPKQRSARRTRYPSGAITKRLYGNRISKTQLPSQCTGESDESGSAESGARDVWIEQHRSTDSAESMERLPQPGNSLSNAEEHPRLNQESQVLISRSEELPDEPPTFPVSPRVPTETVRDKFTVKSALSKSFPNQWSPRPPVSKDTISCSIWEGEKMSKFNLNMLEIGCSVIRAVERQGISSDYIFLACLSTMILPLLSVTFHWKNSQPSTNSSNFVQKMSFIDETQRSFSASVFADSSNPITSQLPAILTDSVLGMHLRVLFCLVDKVSALFMIPLHWLFDVVGFADSPGAVVSALWYVLSGRWIPSLLQTPDFLGRLVVLLGVILRFNIYAVIFFVLSIAERTFQQRLLYAKYFFSLTSARRARKYRVPQFRLNKLSHIKCWLTLRSYLKKRGPQRSVEMIIAAAFYIVFVFGLALCSQLLSKKEESVFSHLANWDLLGLTLAIMLFLHRFIILGTKITKKYRNFSVLITEQINLYLNMEKKPHKKDELTATFQVLRLVESLLKEVDGPFRVCGWTVNPLVYNIFKLVLLSCFSSLLSETLGFKLKLYKLKLNAANW